MISMNKRGISMISLVIIIIVTIILIGIAVTAGYRYIEEANKLKAQVLGMSIGNNAYRRQTDVNSGTAQGYYEGYYLDKDVFLNNHKSFIGLPEDDENNNSIYDVVESGESMWYAFDAESATNLGADGAEGLLTRNISYVMNEADATQVIKIVLADYLSGRGYYVTVPANILKQTIKYDATSACPLSPNGQHKFTIATCTENSECIYGCGTDEGPRALGHKWIAPTCTAPGYCERCNIINPDHSEPLGHLFISNSQISDGDLIAKMAARECIMYEDHLSNEAWITNAEKHWHECIRCGIKKEEEGHSLIHEINGEFYSYVKESDAVEAATYHHQECLICGWHSIKSKHVFRIIYTGDHTHRVECTLCDYVSVHDHTDSGWQPDHPEVHYKYCLDDENCNTISLVVGSVTKKVMITDPHIDEDDDHYCDVCGRLLDYNPPLNFNVEDGDITTYARIKVVDGVQQITTSSVTVEAFTVDKESGVDYYQFGVEVNGTIVWDPTLVYVSSPTDVATHTYTGLNSQTEYNFYVRAYDKAGNGNSPAKIEAKTLGFPEFNGLKNVPTDFVKGDPGVDIGVKDIDSDADNIFIVYKQNDGTWSPKVPIDQVNTISIHLSEETEVLQFKFVDDNDNESPVTTITLNVIDNTPPFVKITNKPGDDNTIEAVTHTAVVTISGEKVGTPPNTVIRPEKSGIAPNTVITYGWSTSDTVPPETTQTHTTTNLEKAEGYAFEVQTPTGVKGTYYLWVFEGVSDAVGNLTTERVISDGFVIDDVRPEVTNIKMFNANPAVAGEDLFVKTGGTVTVTFTVDKVLRYNPVVKIDDQTASTISHNGLDYTCTFPISEIYEEGTLYLFIGDVVAENGRTALRSYDNDDLVKGPVIYDRTLPLIEYIPKKNP